MIFEFATAGRVVFGPGALREIGPLARAFGRRALVVTGRNARRAEPLLAALREHAVGAAVFSVPGEPEIETVRAGVALAKREHCDFVVGFGGGSAIDAGKAVAVMMTHEGDVLDYVEIIGRGRALTRPALRCAAIPTTAGTGSEVTRNAVLASPEHRLKVSLRGASLLPAVAIVDPELAYDLQPALTASTGLDALTQLIEPFVCRRANPLTDALCVEGIARVARSLGKLARENSRDAAAREDMAMASLFGGQALANAGLGATHGFAGPIGGMFPAPHGAVCAALLAPVMEANVRALRARDPAGPALERYRRVARLVTGNPDADIGDGIAWVARLVADCGIPRLGAHGVAAADVGEIVAKAANASSMKANPIVLTPGELADALVSAL